MICNVWLPFCLNYQFLPITAVWNILMALLGAGSAPTLRGFRGPATLAGMVGCCVDGSVADTNHFHADPILIERGNWQSISRISFCILKHCLPFSMKRVWFDLLRLNELQKFVLSWKNRSDPDPQLSGSATLNNWFNC